MGQGSRAVYARTTGTTFAILATSARLAARPSPRGERRPPRDSGDAAFDVVNAGKAKSRDAPRASRLPEFDDARCLAGYPRKETEVPGISIHAEATRRRSARVTAACCGTSSSAHADRARIFVKVKDRPRGELGLNARECARARARGRNARLENHVWHTDSNLRAVEPTHDLPAISLSETTLRIGTPMETRGKEKRERRTKRRDH